MVDEKEGTISGTLKTWSAPVRSEMEYVFFIPDEIWVVSNFLSTFNQTPFQHSKKTKLTFKVNNFLNFELGVYVSITIGFFRKKNWELMSHKWLTNYFYISS